MAGILVSPGFDAAVRKRNGSYKKRGGSPSFKEILRQRCKERFKAKRCSLLNRMRQLESDGDGGSEQVKQILSSLVREEVSLLSSGCPPSTAELEDDMDLDIQPLDKVALTDFEALLMKEYDEMMEEQLESDVDLLDQQVCPLCLRSPLVQRWTEDSTEVTCCSTCQVELPPLDRLLPGLECAYDNHGLTSCSSLPSCSIVHNSLFLICVHCSTMIFVAELDHTSKSMSS